MSVIGSNILAGASSAVSDYTIDQSLRFNDADSAYLSRTPGSESNRRTWTLSLWIKRVENGDAGNILDAGPTPGTNLFTNIYISNDDKFTTLHYDTVGGSGVVWYLVTSAVLRDPSAWYHLVVAVDTTQAVDSNRVKLYINGEQVTDFSTETYPPINTDAYINDNIEHRIGQYIGNMEAEFWNGYLAEFYFIDGTQLAASDFGELKSSTNQWIPLDSDDVKDAVTFGTNGFYLDFSDSADFGDDDSGEGNDWTVNNLVATDQMVDSPTNNFCTLNAVNKSSMTLSEGNLKGLGTT
jgi:hypothetical protein